MARDVFISYRSEDKPSAERICSALEKENISCWIAPRDIPAGQQWAEHIVQALQQCKVFVLVLSSNSTNAKQISREAELADQQGLPIVTFRIEDVQPPPGLLYFLGNLQWLDAIGGNFDAAVGQLAQVARQADTQKAAPRARPVTPAAVVTPVAAAPVAPASYTPAPSGPPPGRSRNLAIGVISVVVLIAAIWFFASRPKSDSNALADARTEAQKFLDALQSKNYDEAWAQFTVNVQTPEAKTRRLDEWTKLDQRLGDIQSHQLGRCTADVPGSVYTCAVKYTYANGKPGVGRVVIAKTGESWGISESTREAAKAAK